VFVQFDGFFGLGQNLLGERHSFFRLSHIVLQDDEVGSVKASQHILWGKTLSNFFTKHEQCLIAQMVTEVRVDDFEVIHIEVMHGQIGLISITRP